MLPPDFCEHANYLKNEIINKKIGMGKEKFTYQTAEKNCWYAKKDCLFFIDSNNFVIYPFDFGLRGRDIISIDNISHLYSTRPFNREYAKKIYPSLYYLGSSNNKEFCKLVKNDFTEIVTNDDDIPF